MLLDKFALSKKANILKGILLTILCLWTASFAFGQEKMEGIGRFKLNKTTIEYLDTLSSEKGYDRSVVNNFSEIFRLRGRSNKLIEIVKDTVEGYRSPTYSHYCKYARVFYIPEITISNVSIKELYLTFLNDTLISIHLDYSSEVVDALNLKYGEGRLESKERETECTLKLTGANVTYNDKMFYRHWENGKINCTAAIGNYRDSKCEKQILSYISIYVLSAEEKLRSCDEKERKIAEEIKSSRKKKELADF